ncbi:hypothetical protein GCM10027066_04010 [Dyella jejuensis]
MKIKAIMSAAMGFACVAAIACLSPAYAATTAGQATVAYFSFVQTGMLTRMPHEFVFAVDDPVLVEQIRDVIANSSASADVHIAGRIDIGREAYNEEWPFHLVPGTVHLFRNAPEVCHATPFEIEEHLAEVGGAFLPGNEWCSWNSRLVREVAVP